MLAYRGSTNELLAVECKSFLDSRGVLFRHGVFETAERYELFTDNELRNVVLERLRQQVIETSLCPTGVRVSLALAAGHVATQTDRAALNARFVERGWRLFDDEWIRAAMSRGAASGYEDNVALVAAKILLRKWPSSERSEINDQAGPA